MLVQYPPLAGVQGVGILPLPPPEGDSPNSTWKKLKNHITPPRLAERIILWFLKDELVEEVLGDLEEKFYVTLNKKIEAKSQAELLVPSIQIHKAFCHSKKQGSNTQTT